jgi:transcriptional regulator with XRE-family HTH domain
MPKTSYALSVNQEIGQRIMSARRRQKLTQRDLAYKLDISYQMLQKHERGTTPLSVDRMLLIAQILACPASDLFPEPGLSRKSKELVANSEEERELIRVFRKLSSNVTRLRFLELLKDFMSQLGA